MYFQLVKFFLQFPWFDEGQWISSPYVKFKIWIFLPSSLVEKFNVYSGTFKHQLWQLLGGTFTLTMRRTLLHAPLPWNLSNSSIIQHISNPELDDGGPQFLYVMWKVISSFHVYPKRSLRRAIGDLHINYSTIQSSPLNSYFTCSHMI